MHLNPWGSKSPEVVIPSIARLSYVQIFKNKYVIFNLIPFQNNGNLTFDQFRMISAHFWWICVHIAGRHGKPKFGVRWKEYGLWTGFLSMLTHCEMPTLHCVPSYWVPQTVVLIIENTSLSYIFKFLNIFYDNAILIVLFFLTFIPIHLIPLFPLSFPHLSSHT